ncbi:MAG: O-antigen ligase family protein, partial [Candidatus Omnitrophica bacterium]|nr:O-antigen ligase family protein [Candidatus Omnitrophota bacterium]
MIRRLFCPQIPRVLYRSRGQASADALELVLSFGVMILLGSLLGYLIVSTPSQVPLFLSVATPLFLLAFFRMDIALAFVIAAMLLSPEIGVGSIPKREVTIRIEDLLIVVLGMAWFARSAVMKGSALIPRTAVNRLVGVYCACFLVSTLRGMITDHVNPVKGAFFVLKYLEYFILFYVAVGTIVRRQQYKVYLTVFFLTLIVVNIYAYTQIGFGRVSAPFEGVEGEPNTLGGYQVLMMSVALGLFCHLKSWKLRWLMAGIVLFTVPPFLYTLSRASYMAFIPAYLSLIVFHRGRQKAVLIGALVAAVVVGIFFIPVQVRQRVDYTFQPQYQAGLPAAEVFGVKLDPSASARMQDWQQVFEAWKKAPFFGYGVTGQRFLDGMYLKNLAELGMVGFLA